MVEHSGKLAGLIVDSATEVLKIAGEDVEAPPAAFQEGGLNCVTGLGKVRGRLIVLLDMTELLAPTTLLQENGTAKARTQKRKRGERCAVRRKASQARQGTEILKLHGKKSPTREEFRLNETLSLT